MNAEQKDVLMRIGAALVFAQSAEQVIRLCMTFVLQKDSPLTIEKLEKQTREERKKTLGYFLGELRKRADLDESFDALLEEFLEERNILVHNVDDVPGWNLQTVKSRPTVTPPSSGAKSLMELLDRVSWRGHGWARNATPLDSVIPQ